MRIIIKDIRNKTLEIQCDKDELYIIENNKEYIWCENFSKKDLVLIYIATKVFDLSDVCIGRAYDIFGNEIPDAYGLFISSEYTKIYRYAVQYVIYRKNFMKEIYMIIVFSKNK